MRRIRVLAGVLVLVMLFTMAAPLTTMSYSIKNLKLKRLKLGATLNVYQSGADYYSRDEEVLYVSPKGLVTAKKLGTANIVIQKGSVKRIQPIEVVANGRKTAAVTVCADEIVLENQKVTLSPLYRTVQTQGTGASPDNGTGGVDNSNTVIVGYDYTVMLSYKNIGTDMAQEIKIDCQLGGKNITLSFANVRAGKTAVSEVSGTFDYIVDENTPLILLKKKVYSNNMLCQYDYNNKKFTYTYGTPDTVPPVITGFIGKNSYNGKLPYMVVYSDDKKYNYFKYVKAVDDRGGKVKLSVDTSKVNFKKAGNYTITYTAEDKAGNRTKARAKIQVRIANELDEMADKILKQITKPGWSNTKKAKAIYNYARENITYVGYSDKTNWEKEAMNGIRLGKGDCFTYYSVARILLTRSGIPNIEVRRVKPDNRGHTRHWWNMVYVQGDYYHYDASPRSVGGTFCLITDEQMKEYSRTHGNSHIWAYHKIPVSGTKHLSDVE